MEHRQQMWALKRASVPGSWQRRSRQHRAQTRDVDVFVEPESSVQARACLPPSGKNLSTNDETRREVRHLHMDIYRLMFADRPADDEQVGELSEKAAHERFESMGFADFGCRHAPRRSAPPPVYPVPQKSTQRILLPGSSGGEGQNPTTWACSTGASLKNFGDEYLGFLRDSPSAAQRLCHVLSNSRFLGDALNKSVERSVTWLGSKETQTRT